MLRSILRQCSAQSNADQLKNDSLELIAKGRFAEYYDPLTGAAYGGVEFTWTAAMVIEFVSQSEIV